MTFVSYKQLIKDVEEFGRRVEFVDCFVGVPRSGLLVANLLSLNLNKRLGVVDDGEIRILRGGDRDDGKTDLVMIIDDSVDTGAALENVRRSITRSVLWGALYVSEGHRFEGNIVSHRTMGPDRLFEWNMWNHGILPDTLADLDDVFTDEGGPVLNRPCKALKAIVTGRTEDRRAETQEWLKTNQIECGELFMRPSTDMTAEDFKATIYADSDAKLFIESSDFQAGKIAERTHRPVLSLETMTLW